MADFFERVKKGLDKGLNTVSVKSQEVIETTKINSQISGLKDQIAKIQQELGAAVYEMNQQGVFDQNGIKEKCDAITELTRQIQAKEVELQAVHEKADAALGQLSCPNCKIKLAEDTKFCGNCGAKVGGE
jgi:NADH pyrophosphatase NudC (nudix superfamily)